MSDDSRVSPGEELARYLTEPAWFRHNPFGIHGVAHVTRVLVWADALAGMIAGPGALRREELRWAAAVHDVGRVNDRIDPGHGERSAEWLLANLPALRPETADLDLPFAADLCRWHETRDRDIPRLSLELLVLKDADALDRARLGDLDPSRLRLARAHDLIELARRLEAATNDYGRTTGAAVLEAARRQIGSGILEQGRSR